MPVSTKTQVSWSPIASCSSTATTDESTPPESPQITRPLPTCVRMAAMALARNDAIDQEPSQPATRRAKFSSNAAPCGVCTTSGWNWMP